MPGVQYFDPVMHGLIISLMVYANGGANHLCYP